MSANDTRISRRSVLRATGGAAAAVGVTGLASAKPGDRVRVNVGFSEGSGRAAALSRADRVVHDFDFGAVTLELPKRGAEALAKRPDVRYVEADTEVHALAQTLPWGVDRVDAEVAHANGETGSGADVAIIDTGIDSDHPDLQANLGSGTAFARCRGGPKTCGFDWDDDYGHGTHCAGIAGAIDDNQGVVGVAPGITLHSVKVLDKRGSGTSSDVAAGIEYTADQGWDVGSLSLGSSTASQVIKDAGEYAAQRGVLLVAAAGNSGPCSNCVGYPAAFPEFMAVSSTNDSDNLSSFSSTGSQVEIAAPGTDIYATVPGGYDTLSGTSMATPHVSAAGGMLMANGQSASQARSTLTSTAEDLGLSSNEQGAGLLDVAAALGFDSSDN